MIEAMRTSELFVPTCEATVSHNPEDHSPRVHHHENLKSHIEIEPCVKSNMK
jgi:hypothetical protein